MGLAVVRRLFNRDELETQEPNLEIVTREELSQEELEAFKDVIDRYAKADEHDRLNLWLYHRDLRETFEVLDRIG